MTTERNREILVRIFDALSRSDGLPFYEALSEDAVWIAPGTNSWAGTYRGKTAIRDELMRPLRARLGSIRSIADEIIVDGDLAAVQFHGDNMTVEGERYANRYALIVRFRDGKIIEMTEFMDTELVTRVLGERVVVPAS